MQIEKYKERYGCYPASVHADKIYLTRENRRLCRDVYYCRLSGKPLGRPKVETEENKEKLRIEKKQRNQDYIDRIAIEGRFGVAKRRYGMDKMVETEMKEINDRYKIRRKRAALKTL